MYLLALVCGSNAPTSFQNACICDFISENSLKLHLLHLINASSPCSCCTTTIQKLMHSKILICLLLEDDQISLLPFQVNHISHTCQLLHCQHFGSFSTSHSFQFLHAKFDIWLWLQHNTIASFSNYMQNSLHLG